MLKNKPELKQAAIKALQDDRRKLEETRKIYLKTETEACFTEMSKVFPDLELRGEEIWLDDIRFSVWRCGTKFPSGEKSYALVNEGLAVSDMAGLGRMIEERERVHKQESEKSLWTKFLEKLFS